MGIEEAINSYHRSGAREQFIRDLLKRKIVPGIDSGGTYYLKDDAAAGLASRLVRDGVIFDFGETPAEFAAALYGSINKVPLKQVGYGMLNATLPGQVAKQLSPWEAVYAYTGIWAKKSATSPRYGFTEHDLERSTLYQIARDIIMRGMERIAFVHNKEVDAGRYKNRIDKVPHEAEIMERFKLSTQSLRELNAVKNPGQQSLF